MNIFRRSRHLPILMPWGISFNVQPKMNKASTCGHHTMPHMLGPITPWTPLYALIIWRSCPLVFRKEIARITTAEPAVIKVRWQEKVHDYSGLGRFAPWGFCQSPPEAWLGWKKAGLKWGCSPWKPPPVGKLASTWKMTPPRTPKECG
jgi:hypothetical protein